MSSTLFLVLLMFWGAGGSSLNLTASTNIIRESQPSNLSLTCSLDEETGNQTEKSLEKAVTMRILKLQTSQWTPVIEMESTWKIPRVIDDLQGSASVGEKGVNQLQVNWPLATVTTAGQYVCEINGYTQDQKTIRRNSPIIVIDIDRPFTLYQLLKTYQTSNLKLETAMKEYMTQSQITLDSLSTIYIEEWPQGAYGLLQPESGCPADVGVNWNSGSRTHTTEFEERNKDEVSLPNHLKEPYMWIEGSTKLMGQHFCSVTTPSTGRLWPAGTYCINRYKNENCPIGFQNGNIFWDDEDTNNNNSFDGVIPASTHDSTTRINYCCRNDKSPRTPIHLPQIKSFYLYRFGGTCQEVAGMEFFPEYMLFHTDCCSTHSGSTPDGSNSTGSEKFIKLELCYYESFEHWPKGVYSLLQTESGCPANNGVEWMTGERTHHSDPIEGKKNKVSSPAHLKKPVMWKTGTFTFMRQHFCTVTKPSTGRVWPAGSYCVSRYKNEKCPSGFEEGNIYWDDQDSNNKNSYSGIIPATQHNAGTHIYYCCRNDSSPLTAINLPRQTAFFLYRFGGTCQEVVGMKVTPEYMSFATDCCSSYKSRDFAPDGQTGSTRVELQLCYYQPT